MATTINADTSEGLKLTSDTSGELELQSAGVTKVKITSSGLQNASGNPITSQSGQNLIINGNMQIAQRGTSKTGITTTGYYTLDRFTAVLTTAGTWTQTQDTDVPTGQGFSSSLKMACTTANASLAAADQLNIQQRIEAQNLQHLKYGTSNAESLTMSFWVKSNKTGTYTFWIYQGDSLRAISKTYTIDSADTWEKKTITIEGDTFGVIDNNNDTGLWVTFYLAAGSNFTSGTLNTSWNTNVPADRVSSSNVNLADSTSNYINITGIQLEVGTTETPFQHLQYGQQLALCQRYYYKWDSSTSNNWVAWAMAANTTNMYGHVPFPTTMRSNPSSIEYSGLGWWLGGSVTAFSAVAIAESGTNSCTMNFTSTGLTSQKMYAVLPNGGTNYIAFNSEL